MGPFVCSLLNRGLSPQCHSVTVSMLALVSVVVLKTLCQNLNRLFACYSNCEIN
jgi:hypothetical protein